MTTPAIPLAEELDSIGKRIIWIIEKFGDRYPGLHEKYSLIELLYWREYVADQWMKTMFDVLIERAAAGDDRIPNVLSIHRAQTIVKKLFQDEKDRVRSDEKEAEWKGVLSPDPGPGPVDFYVGSEVADMDDPEDQRRAIAVYREKAARERGWNP